MKIRERRGLALVAEGGPLRRYADAMQPDRNAAHLMVHQALAAALRVEPEPAADELRSLLQEDIDRRYALAAPLRDEA